MASVSSVDVFGVVLGILIAMVAVMGNGLVLYASYGKQKSMKFSVVRDLDIVIKSLAVTDLLIGLVGFPARALAGWALGASDMNEDHNKGISGPHFEYDIAQQSNSCRSISKHHDYGKHKMLGSFYR